MGHNQAKPSYIPKPTRDERQYLETQEFKIGSGLGFKYVKLSLPEGFRWKDRSPSETIPEWYIIDPDGKIVAQYMLGFCGEYIHLNRWIYAFYDIPNDLQLPIQEHVNPLEEDGPLFPSIFGEILYINVADKILDLWFGEG